MSCPKLVAGSLGLLFHGIERGLFVTRLTGHQRGLNRAVSGIVGGFLPIDAATAYTLDLVVSFVFITLLFAVIYKFVPDVRIAWRDVWIGAATTSLLFSVGKFLIGFYLGHSTVTSIYGAAGSLVTLLLWVYYSSLMFFFGAELTQVYATRFGSKVTSAENAQRGRPASISHKTGSLSSEERLRGRGVQMTQLLQRPTTASPEVHKIFGGPL